MLHKTLILTLISVASIKFILYNRYIRKSIYTNVNVM